MDYTFDSSFLGIVKKTRGVDFKTLAEARLARTLGQQYSAFLVGHNSCDVAVGGLIPGMSTLDKWSRVLIRDFFCIHNVVTNLMRATNLPRLFCIFCGSGFMSRCLGLICL